MPHNLYPIILPLLTILIPIVLIAIDNKGLTYAVTSSILSIMLISYSRRSIIKSEEIDRVQLELSVVRQRLITAEKRENLLKDRVDRANENSNRFLQMYLSTALRLIGDHNTSPLRVLRFMKWMEHSITVDSPEDHAKEAVTRLCDMGVLPEKNDKTDCTNLYPRDRTVILE